MYALRRGHDEIGGVLLSKCKLPRNDDTSSPYLVRVALHLEEMLECPSIQREPILFGKMFLMYHAASLRMNFPNKISSILSGNTLIPSIKFHYYYDLGNSKL